jgi:hypothetical protein
LARTSLVPSRTAGSCNNLKACLTPSSNIF